MRWLNNSGARRMDRQRLCLGLILSSMTENYDIELNEIYLVVDQDLNIEQNSLHTNNGDIETAALFVPTFVDCRTYDFALSNGEIGP